MEKLKLLIGSCVCQTPVILRQFLASLKAVDVSEFDTCFLYVDDNQDPASSQMLREAEFDFKAVGTAAPLRQEAYQTNEITHYWNDALVRRIAVLKNTIISYAIAEGYDRLFLIDSDLLIDPKLIKHLIAQDKEIISEIFWTAWQPGTIPMPNVWQCDKYEMAHPSLSLEEYQKQSAEFIAKLRTPGVYEVGGLGALTMLSVDALKAGLHFSPIKNISLWGEDRWFCVRAAALGFPLFIDTHFPAKHLYRTSDLAEA